MSEPVAEVKMEEEEAEARTLKEPTIFLRLMTTTDAVVAPQTQKKQMPSTMM